MIKRLLLILSLLICSAAAQNSRFDGIVLNRNGMPLAGASIAVCLQPVTGTVPCTNPAPLCSSASDAVCTSPNPVTADSLGNYFGYVKPGKYTLQFYGSGLTTRTQADQILACDPSNCQLSGALTTPSIAINGGTPITGQTGTGATVVMSASPTITGTVSGTPIVPSTGVTDGSAAAAGVVGQLMSVTQATPQSLTNNTFLNLGTLALTAGDWDVQGTVQFTGTTATATQEAIGISTSTSAIAPSDGTFQNQGTAAWTTFASGGAGIVTPVYRVSISGTTNYSLVVVATFASGTCLAQGAIRARRVR